MEITARNVNGAFSEVFSRFKTYNLQAEETRNGSALVFPEPVMTTYLRPAERVLFDAGRDANPIFHLMESIWMIAGRRDVEFLTHFNRRMVDFSDDGKVFNAAYGYRWRNHFGRDQLDETIRLLRRDPTTRQAVIQIWDNADLQKSTKDKACNTQVVFDTRASALNMSVFNRSNDIWWGAYGANAVHFSFMQEFVASALNLPLGRYWQLSHNFHLYKGLYNAGPYLDNPPEANDLYERGVVHPYPIMSSDDYRLFMFECEMFCEDPFNTKLKYANSFFSEVATPMALVSKARRDKTSSGLEFANQIKAEDWRAATIQWIEKREKKK